MTIEIKMLVYTIVLGFFQLFLAIAVTTKERGIKWNMSARDQKLPDLTGVAARLDRALKNFLETFPFFAASVLIVSVLKIENDSTALGAQIYLIARVLYVPVYALGTPVLRTIIWGASFVGIFKILSACF